MDGLIDCSIVSLLYTVVLRTRAVSPAEYLFVRVNADGVMIGEEEEFEQIK